MTPVSSCAAGHKCLHGRALLGALLLVGLPLVPASLGAQQANPVSYGRDVRAVLETDRPTYHVGDSVRVRVSLTNLSDHTVVFTPMPPWYQVRLVLTRDGQMVKPNVAGGGGAGGSPFIRLPAHRTVAWNWLDQVWLPLEAWGYSLREPGTYAIQGIPQIFGKYVADNDQTVRSNTVTITILP